MGFVPLRGTNPTYIDILVIKLILHNKEEIWIRGNMGTGHFTRKKWVLS